MHELPPLDDMSFFAGKPLPSNRNAEGCSYTDSTLDRARWLVGMCEPLGLPVWIDEYDLGALPHDSPKDRRVFLVMPCWFAEVLNYLQRPPRLKFYGKQEAHSRGLLLLSKDPELQRALEAAGALTGRPGVWKLMAYALGETMRGVPKKSPARPRRRNGG